MARLDRYSETPYATENTLNAAPPLNKEQAAQLSAVANDEGNLSADTAFLAALNPNLTAEQRYVANELANQNYEQIKEEQMGWLEHAVRTPVKVAFAAFDYIPDVANNIIGTSIGQANGDFENPEDVSKAWANVFGAGTTLGQMIGQSFDTTEGIDTGSDFFATDESNVMQEKFNAQAQLYGWDSRNEYGDRTNLGSVVAGQLFNLEKDSPEFEFISTIADTLGIGLYFLGLSQVSGAIKGVQTGVKFAAKNTKAFAETKEIGKTIAGAQVAKGSTSDIEKTISALESEARTVLGDDVVDLIDDAAAKGVDIVTPLTKDANRLEEARVTSGKAVKEEAMLESVNNVTSKPLTVAARADKLDAQLEAEKMAIDAQILNANKSVQSRIDEIDVALQNAPADIIPSLKAERELLTTTKTTVTRKDYEAGPVKTVSEIDNELIAAQKQLRTAKGSVTRLTNKGAKQSDIDNAKFFVDELNSKIDNLKAIRESAPASKTDRKGYSKPSTKTEEINPALEALYKRKEDIETIQNALRTSKAKLNEKSVEAANKFMKDYGFTPEAGVKNYDDAIQFFNDVIGLRKTADNVNVQNVDKTLQWVTNGGLNGIVENILNINRLGPEEAGGRLMSLLRNQIPQSYVKRLKNATDENEVKSILTQALTAGDINIRLGKLRRLKWQSRIIDRNGNIKTLNDPSYKNAYGKAFENVAIKTVLWVNDKKNILAPWTHAYKTTDEDGMVMAVVDSIDFTFGKFGISLAGAKAAKWRSFKNKSVTKMMDAKTPEERFQTWYQIQDDMITFAAGWENMTPKQQKALRDAFKSARAAANGEVKRMAEMAAKKTISETTEIVDENIKDLAEAVLYEMHLSDTVSMINPYDMRLMIRKGKSIFEIQENMKFGKGYEWARNLLNVVFHDFFRRAVLFRIGYIVRNVLETQGRMYLTGHPSLLTNPTFIVSALMNTEQSPRLQKAIENFAKTTVGDLKMLNRGNVDVTGMSFNMSPETVKRLDEIDNSIYSLNAERSQLRQQVKKTRNETKRQDLQKQLDDVDAQLDTLYNEREILEPKAEFDQFAFETFTAGSDRGMIADPTELMNNPMFAAKNGYLNAQLDSANFLSGLAEYVLRISSDNTAKNVLAALNGKKLNKDVVAWVNKNKLNHLTSEQQVLDYYWYGTGQEVIDSLRAAQGGKNASRYATKDDLKEYLFGESQTSVKTLVYNFTDGFEPKFVDIILYGKIAKVDANGNVIIKQYPIRTVDEVEDLENVVKVKSDYARQLKDVREAYEDVVDGWKANPQTAKILSVPKADWENILKNSQIGNFFKGASDTIYRWASQMEKTFATVPEFLYSHWDAVARDIIALSPEDAVKVVKVAESTLGGIPGSWGAIVLKQIKTNAKKASGNGIFTIEDLRIGANNQAASAVEKMFYNAGKRNALGHALRFVLPFGQAWANSLLTWGKLAVKNPAQVYKAELFLKSLETEGSGWLYNPLGVDVQNEYDKDQPFIYTDEKTGKKVFGIPMIGPMSVFFSNISSVIAGRNVNIDLQSFGSTIDVGSLNLVMQNDGLPGFGPMLTIPLDFLNMTLPNLSRMIPDELRSAINPFLKDPNQAFSIEGSLIPAWAKEILSPIFFPEIRNKYIPSAINALLTNQADMYFDVNGQISQDKMIALIKDAEAISNGLAFGRGLWQILSPGSSKLEVKIKDEDGEYHKSAIVSAEYHDLMNQGNDQNEAMAKMIDTYGWNALVSMISTSRSGYTPTGDAWDAFKNDPSLVETDGSVFSLFFPGGGYNAYLAHEQNTGSVKKSPEDFVKDINYSKFVARQGQLDFKLANGLISEQDYEVAIDSLNATAEKVPMPQVSRNWRSQQVFELEEALKNPTLANTKAGQALNIYLQARGEALQYGDLGNKGQYENKMRLFDIGAQLAAQNPEFSVMWVRVLRSEVKPENNELTMQGAK